MKANKNVAFHKQLFLDQSEKKTRICFFKGPWSASAIFDDIEIIDIAW